MRAKTSVFGDTFSTELTIFLFLTENGVYEMTFYVILACADLECNITDEDSIKISLDNKLLSQITYENIPSTRIWNKMSLQFVLNQTNNAYVKVKF